MRKIEGLALRRLGTEAILVAGSIDLIDFDRLVTLNASAEYVWESLPDSDFGTDDVVRLLTTRYDVDEATARSDAEELLRVWSDAGIIVV